MSSQATPSGPESKWIKCISVEGNVRGVAIQATELVRSMAKRHKVQGEAAKGLAESVMGALMIASYCKGGERVNLNIQGSGLIKQALIDAHPDGSVRGYVIERERVGDLLPGSGPWGEGLLSVLRAKGGEKERPYIGTVPLLTGHLAKDLTFYWMQSEQIPSAVGLAVCLEDGEVTAAGGFLVQVLPGATSEEVKAIEQNIQEIQSLAAEVADHQEPTYLLSKIFQSSPFLLVEEKTLEFRCNCSWERVERAMALVGPEELGLMLAEDGKASVRCDFCTKEYLLDASALKELIELTKKRES